MKANRQIQINTDTAAYIPQLRLDCRFEKMSFGNANTNITDMKKSIKAKIAVDLSPGSCLPIIFGILIFYHQHSQKKVFIVFHFSPQYFAHRPNNGFVLSEANLPLNGKYS